MNISKEQRQLREKYSGFGVEKALLPHHFRVEIPKYGRSPVTIIEDYGIECTENSPYETIRVSLPRSIWAGISEKAAADFNVRLKESGAPSGKWHTGYGRDAVKVERLLGKELCVLAWAAETAKKDQLEAITLRWASLRPHERWWLFSMVITDAGSEHDTYRGWRQALYCALADSPAEVAPTAKRKRRSKIILEPEFTLV